MYKLNIFQQNNAPSKNMLNGKSCQLLTMHVTMCQ